MRSLHHSLVFKSRNCNWAANCVLVMTRRSRAEAQHDLPTTGTPQAGQPDNGHAQLQYAASSFVQPLLLSDKPSRDTSSSGQLHGRSPCLLPTTPDSEFVQAQQLVDNSLAPQRSLAPVRSLRRFVSNAIGKGRDSGLDADAPDGLHADVHTMQAAAAQQSVHAHDCHAANASPVLWTRMALPPIACATGIAPGASAEARAADGHGVPLPEPLSAREDLSPPPASQCCAVPHGRSTASNPPSDHHKPHAEPPHAAQQWAPDSAEAPQEPPALPQPANTSTAHTRATPRHARKLSWERPPPGPSAVATRRGLQVFTGWRSSRRTGDGQTDSAGVQASALHACPNVNVAGSTPSAPSSASLNIALVCPAAKPAAPALHCGLTH